MHGVRIANWPKGLAKDHLTRDPRSSFTLEGFRNLLILRKEKNQPANEKISKSLLDLGGSNVLSARVPLHSSWVSSCMLVR